MSRTRCAFSGDYGATLEGVKICIGKDPWLLDFPLNYLTANFEAKTARSEEELTASNAEKTCGIGMKFDGRVCKCKYRPNKYYSIQLNACVPEPTSFDGEHDMRYSCLFYQSGSSEIAWMLIDLDTCTEIDRYRTTDFKDCIYYCPSHTDNNDMATYQNYQKGLDSAGR